MHKLALAGQAAIRTSARHKAATVFSTEAEGKTLPAGGYFSKIARRCRGVQEKPAATDI